MSRARWSLIGAGIGAAAGAATTAGVVVDRLRRGRRAAVELGTDPTQFEETADHEYVVVAEDGVPLHVESDDPRGPAPDAGGARVPTVVLTHGYTHDLGVWVLQRRTLRDAGYRVVLWDLRGHGQSGEGEDSAYTVTQLGHDLERVLAEVVPEGPVVLIGHSMGAMATMSLAGSHPKIFTERVIGVGLISGSAGDLASIDFGLGKTLGAVVHRTGPAAVARLASRPAVLQSARATGKSLEEYLVHRYSFASQVPLAVVRWTADMIFRTDLEVIGAFFTHLMTHDETEALASLIGVETLVMHGTEDRIIPATHAELIVDAVPGCEFVQVPEAGHVLPLECPEVVDTELLALITRARRGSDTTGRTE